MLNTIASKIAMIMYQKKVIEKARIPVYRYGLELGLSTSLGSLAILALSVLLHSLISGIVFLSIFISVRMFLGGYHATTYSRCFILSNIVYVLAQTAAYIQQIFICDRIQIIIMMISCGVICCLSPVRNIHHPLKENTYRKNASMGRKVVVCEFVAIMIIYAFFGNMLLLSISSASFAAIAALMIIPKARERRSAICGK